ncbi:MAG: hypothetical protein ABI466_04745 [Chloroflexota bacterium]
MNTTETTPTPAVDGRKIGQLLAGRYRLAMSKGGDDTADVWHALDESTGTVVTLEILRGRDNEAARQRFLAEARRMAAIERPSVMRVTGIHDEGTETFIVFEHLIPLPVVLTGLTAVARDVRPATKAAEDNLAADKTVVLTAAVPAPIAPSSTLAAVAGPKRTAAAPSEDIGDLPTPSTIVELDVPDAVAAQPAATTAAASGAGALAARFAADARLLLRDLELDTLFDSVRARVAAVPVARVMDQVRQLAGAASQARVPSARRPPAAPSDAAPAAPSAPVLQTITTLTMGLAAAAGPLIARARRNRIVLAGGGLILLAVVVIASPLDDAIGSALRPGPAPSPTAAPPAALAPAPFQVPPLSAYGAAFESQGAYPTTAPNGTVEWVVALRNTGSAGWHRGIEGAQAALALPDGAGVAVQSTPYVAPGQVGWFVVHFRARAELGTYNVQLLPRIDGRGPLQDLGIYAVVTVAKNP